MPTSTIPIRPIPPSSFRAPLMTSEARAHLACLEADLAAYHDRKWAERKARPSNVVVGPWKMKEATP
jgi:hypothetical protein